MSIQMNMDIIGWMLTFTFISVTINLIFTLMIWYCVLPGLNFCLDLEKQFQNAKMDYLKTRKEREKTHET